MSSQRRGSSVCFVNGCRNRGGRKGDTIHFYRIPKIIKGQGQETLKLSTKRRREWTAAVNRTKEFTAHSRICSEHFIQGKPAKLYEVNHPDWVPSMLLSGKEREPIEKRPRVETLSSRKRARFERVVDRQQVTNMPKSCCVHGCTANKKSFPDRQFYIIPSEKCCNNRRERWLAAINRAVLNPDGSVNKTKRWSPKSGHCYVCSAHFVTGAKVNEPFHPDYVPSVFPKTSEQKLKKSTGKFDRYRRAENRSSSAGVQSENPDDPNWIPTIFAHTAARELQKSAQKKRRSKQYEALCKKRLKKSSSDSKPAQASLDFEISSDSTLSVSENEEFNQDNNELVDENADNCDCIGCADKEKQIHILQKEKLLIENKVKYMELLLSFKGDSSSGDKCEMFLSSGDRVTYYTGLENRRAFDKLHTAVHSEADKLTAAFFQPCDTNTTERSSNVVDSSPTQKVSADRKLSTREQLLMVLMKLNLNINTALLADIMGISESLVMKISDTWVQFLFAELQN